MNAVGGWGGEPRRPEAGHLTPVWLAPGRDLAFLVGQAWMSTNPPQRGVHWEKAGQVPFLSEASMGGCGVEAAAVLLMALGLRGPGSFLPLLQPRRRGP